MARDEALLHSASDRGVASLRFYTWAEPTLSLGYFQPSADRPVGQEKRQHAARYDDIGDGGTAAVQEGRCYWHGRKIGARVRRCYRGRRSDGNNSADVRAGWSSARRRRARSKWARTGRSAAAPADRGAGLTRSGPEPGSGLHP